MLSRSIGRIPAPSILAYIVLSYYAIIGSRDSIKTPPSFVPMTGMEAIAAFGLACNVIQVVHFSIDVVSKCRELYRQDSLSRYDPLEHMINHLTSLRNALDFPLAQGNQNICQVQDQALLGLAEKCSITAKELSGELQKLKINGPHRKRQIIRNSARCPGKNSSIEKIQTRLDEYRKILDSRILIGIRSVVCSLTSRNDFTDLSH